LTQSRAGAKYPIDERSIGIAGARGFIDDRETRRRALRDAFEQRCNIHRATIL